MSGPSENESSPAGEALNRTKTGRSSFSVLRVVIAVVVLAVTAVGGGLVALQFANNRDSSSAPMWFAPYVDATLTPEFDFQDPQTNSSLDVVLGFVVASKRAACQPSWGASYTLDEADDALDLERRVVRQRQRGGDVMVSFGGALNDEIAVVCTDDTALTAAYTEVVKHLDLTMVDFDLEGPTLSNTAANVRRAKAIAAVQKAQRDAGSDLMVWLTLPVAPDGLDQDAQAAIDSMLDGGVDLAGVNILTMNYGSSRRSSVSFVDASMDAADATFTVLSNAYRRSGVARSSAEVWQRIGITPMIGQNDTITDVLDIDGVRQMHADARDRGIGRISMWSANRDKACGGNLLPTVVNNNCSGVEQEQGQFAKVLSAGSTTISAPEATTAASADQRGASTVTTAVESTENLPYPLWRRRREYDTGVLVVWGGVVYESKWWTLGDPPDAIVDHPWDSPWRVIGPVLPDEPPPLPPVTIPPGTFPTWNLDSVFFPGDRVQHNGLGYKAKWWTRGDNPSADPDNAWETPWELIDSSSIVVTPPPTTVPGTE